MLRWGIGESRHCEEGVFDRRSNLCRESGKQRFTVNSTRPPNLRLPAIRQSTYACLRAEIASVAALPRNDENRVEAISARTPEYGEELNVYDLRTMH